MFDTHVLCCNFFLEHFFCFFKQQSFVRSRATSFGSFRFFGVLHSDEDPGNGSSDKHVVSLDSSDVFAKHIHFTNTPRLIEIKMDITIWVHQFTVIIVCVLGKETCCLIYIQTDRWTQEYRDEEN